MLNPLLGLCALLLGLAATAVLASHLLKRSTAVRILTTLDGLPRNTLIVALGCPPVTRSGRPNRYLLGRVAAAAEAYHRDPSRDVLCTGRRQPDGIDEAKTLAQELIRAGVAESSIALDSSSRRTIDSIAHLRSAHRSRPILLVTQAYHLPRALFLARRAGLDAYGWPANSPRPDRRARTREALSRVRAILESAARRHAR